MGRQAWLLCGLLLVGGMLLTGCQPKEGANTSDSTTPNAQSSDDGQSAKIAANMAKLSAEDRAAAEKQKICPVSGQPLGGMDVPFKVTVKEQEVFLCCGGCETEIKGDPDKYIAKLSK